MPRTLSSNATQSLTAESTDEIWLCLLTIDHDDLDAPIRVVHNNEAITSRGDVFEAFAFEIELPGQSSEGPGEAMIRIDNTDRLIVNTIRSIQTPATVTIELILADSPNTVEIALPPLQLRDVTYNVSHVTGYLKFEDLMTEAVSETITAERFPALF